MATHAPQPGDLVGRVLEDLYRVEKQLDKGGMGTVYLARHLRLGNLVVVKVPASPAAGALDGRLEAEIDQLTDLQHPHIVRVRDKVRVNGLPCAVLDYLPRGNLRRRMKDHGLPMSPPDTLAWLAPIAQALDHLHGRQIVHRDVKPGNIVFDDADQAMLVDFGIAKVTGEVGLTDTGNFPGSPQYMAPELEPTAAYDQFALATVVYECLTGRLPWDDVHPARLVARKQREDPARAESLNARVPRALADCVHRALSRDPSRRYASCSEFAEAFRARMPAIAPPGPRRPRPLHVIAAAVLLLAGGMLVRQFLPRGGAGDLSPGERAGTTGAPLEAPAGRSLRDILLRPTPNASGAELVVASRPFRPEETPQSATRVRPGDDVHVYSRTTDATLGHLLVLLIDDAGRINILQPENLLDETRSSERWRKVSQVTAGPEVSRDLVIAYASERPWQPLLALAAPPPPDALSGDLWTAEGEAATRLAEAIADETAGLGRWSRASEALAISGPD